MRSYKRDICYPIFLQVSQLSSDTFWKYLFEDMSYGIVPFGVCMDDKTVYCRFRGKQFHYIYDGNTPHDINLYLTQTFKLKLGIQSKIDCIQNKMVLGNILVQQCKQWKDIKKKNIKNIIIENFVIQLKHKYKLDVKQSQRLLCFINVAFMFKMISNSDVIYDCEQCIIKDINGIDFQKLLSKKRIIVTKNIVSSVQCENQSSEKRKIHEMWLKYINTI